MGKIREIFARNLVTSKNNSGKNQGNVYAQFGDLQKQVVGKTREIVTRNLVTSKSKACVKLGKVLHEI